MLIELNNYWRCGLVAGVFGLTGSALIAPLPAQAASLTQVSYQGDIILSSDSPLFLLSGVLPATFTLDETVEVDDLANRLVSGASLTPEIGPLQTLLRDFAIQAVAGLPFENLVSTVMLSSLNGVGNIFDAANNPLTSFQFSYSGGPELLIDGYIDAFNAGELNSCLVGLCFIKGSGSGSLSSDTLNLPFEIAFNLAQTATPLGGDPDPSDPDLSDPDPSDPDPDDSVAVPEPTSILGLLAIAGGGLTLKRRRSHS
ncbi:PEP-CTERM sorting domain-containing protein [Leptolyngbya sp. PCC 6406]|uniref:PEP-CTERM sorting domain-containing protein n=1 Tax=Leptolyngbya sp. PCC 6406 TaxID=1173264 RepID=UPI0002ACB0C5|nr:PEP-CTERM sorting domain-containing protein [Leptolyngbya sp. PCC 6406]